MSKDFIILEPDPIVCMDLEGMLIGRFPNSYLAQGASLSDIGAAIYNCGPDSVLFIRSTLMDESDDIRRVVQTIASRGSHVVIIGQQKQVAFPATFVDLPFTTEMVFSAVDAGASRDACDAPGAMS